MYKKFTAITAAALCGIMPLSANLIKDSGFDTDKFNDVYYTQSNGGSVKVTRITEDMTWNKCLKMEITSFFERNGVKSISAELVFGKTDGKIGFAVEPDSVYNFSFDFKGNHQLSLHVALDGDNKIDRKRGKVNIRPNPLVAKPDPAKWSTVKGTFKTQADTRFMRLRMMIWADSKQQSVFSAKVGDFILIDNVKIEKRRSLDDAAPVAKAAPLKPAYPVNSSCEANLTVDPAPWLKGTQDVPAKLTWQSTGDALVCTMVYNNPDTAKHKYYKQPKPTQVDGKVIWNDDVMEFFFSRDPNNKEYIQFACSRNGGRCRLISGKEAMELNKWSAVATTRNGKTEYKFTIPYTLLGYKGAPESGSIIKFNAGIKHNGIYYSFAPVKSSFCDVATFALLGFGSIKDYQKNIVAKLQKDAPEAVKNLIDAFAKKNFANLALAVQAADTLKTQIVSARMGKAPFVLAQLPLNGNYSAPLEIGVENVVKDEIKLQAAGNETAMLPLVIVNRTAQTAAYRVVLHDDAANIRLHENHTLSNGFPAENITLREGVAVKDSDSPNPGTIFDSLPRMNEAQTVSVAANESALVWLEFNTANVKPGKYNGSVRIIPLSEPATHTYNSYQGAMRDYPISLEVLPFELPAPGPAWLCGSIPGTVDHLRYMRLIGTGRIHITPYLAKHKFNQKGELVDDNGSHERLVEAFKAGLEDYKKLNASGDKRKFLFGYNSYKCFTRTSMPQGMKPLTSEWENCWRNHLKAIKKAILAAGVSMADVVFEVWDEPRGKEFKLLLRITQIMRETLPDAVLSVTWPCQNFEFTPEMMGKFDDLLDEHIYHKLLRTDPKYKAVIKRMDNRPNTHIGVYQCSTGIREDLHIYYRLHPWVAYRMNCDILVLYQFSNMPWGQCGATDWKHIPAGAIVNRAGNSCIPSIRYMALRRGVDDIRYMKALEKYAGKPDVDKLLKEAAKRVEDGSFDGTVPDRIRAEVVKLIKKYQK